MVCTLIKIIVTKRKTKVWNLVPLFLSFYLIWYLFIPPAISPLPQPCLSLLGGGIMWLSGELNRGAEAAAAGWIIDGNLGVTRLGLLTSLLLHLAAGLTRQNGRREREREEESIVWLENSACLWLQVNYGRKDNDAPISVRIHYSLNFISNVLSAPAAPV